MNCAKQLPVFALVVVLAFSACWLSNRFWHRSMPDSHQMLHEQLQITAEQDRKLQPIEQGFLTRKIELEATIKEANAELGKAILADKSNSPRVKAAVEEIHHAQGELQKATLEHLFEMQSVLTPEQSGKLNRLAADALIHNP